MHTKACWHSLVLYAIELCLKTSASYDRANCPNSHLFDNFIFRTNVYSVMERFASQLQNRPDDLPEKSLGAVEENTL